nr:hypothetical protein [Tanacetum cinerariifolium]
EEKHDDVSGCPISGAVADSLEIARILCDYCDESFKDLRDSTLHLQDEDVVVLVSATNVSKDTYDHVSTAVRSCSTEDSSDEWFYLSFL